MVKVFELIPQEHTLRIAHQAAELIRSLPTPDDKLSCIGILCSAAGIDDWVHMHDRIDHLKHDVDLDMGAPINRDY